jgi:signal peptidase I
MDLEEIKPIWRREGLAEAGKTILIALALALGIKTFLFQPFSIPSSSMEGTLEVGDYLVVSKYSYGYSRYSLPFSESLPQFGRVWRGSVARGDVAVFRFPPDPTHDYIKRVVGLPGDRVQIRGGVLVLNGRPSQMTAAGSALVSCPDGKRRATLYRETLSGGASYVIAHCYPPGSLEDTQEFRVPAGHYFVLGDNRDNSRDSRISSLEFGVGFVPEENLVGRAQVIFFSTDGSAGPLQFWRWPFAIRFDRLFDGVQ